MCGQQVKWQKKFHSTIPSDSDMVISCYVFYNFREQTVISRQRLGHTGLNKTMHLIGEHPSELCECGLVEEMVEQVTPPWDTTHTTLHVKSHSITNTHMLSGHTYSGI